MPLCMLMHCMSLFRKPWHDCPLHKHLKGEDIVVLGPIPVHVSCLRYAMHPFTMPYASEHIQRKKPDWQYSVILKTCCNRHKWMVCSHSKIANLDRIILTCMISRATIVIENMEDLYHFDHLHSRFHLVSDNLLNFSQWNCLTTDLWWLHLPMFCLSDFAWMMFLSPFQMS